MAVSPEGGARRKGKGRQRDNLHAAVSKRVWTSVGEKNLKLKRLWRDDLNLSRQLKWLAVAITRVPTFPYAPLHNKGRKHETCVELLANDLAVYFKQRTGNYLYEDIGYLLYRTWWPGVSVSKKSFKSRARYYVKPRWLCRFVTSRQLS
jgi:hypothetical protein